MKIINFSSKDPSTDLLIISSDKQIAGYNPEITFHSADSSFRAKYGCVSILITPSNIDKLLSEIEFPKAEKRTVEVIVLKSKLTPTSSSSTYLESSDNMLISTTGKCFSKSLYQVVKYDKVVTPEYFRPYGTSSSYIYIKNQIVAQREIPEIKRILNIIKEYYNSITVTTDEANN